MRSRHTAKKKEQYIIGTTALGVEGLTVCFLPDSKMDLFTLDRTMTGQKYNDFIIQDIVVPYFDNQNMATRPKLMENNAKLHRLFISAINTFPVRASLI